ncbi:MAG: hypothetical protein J6J44_10665 [Lachnospiraceae bacterium]|nr:hypothetical protein [Lachnospiraceae bacterium]
MGRKNIFQIMESMRDLSKEITRLESMLNDKKGVRLYDSSYPLWDMEVSKYMKIEEFVDEYAFKTWKARRTCVNLEDLLNTLGINDMFSEDDFCEENVLIYLEYVANVLWLAKKVKTTKKYTIQLSDVFNAVEENLVTVLDWLNYEMKLYEKKEQVLVVRKNASATSVAEIVEDNLAYQIVKYNHHSLKGDIESKKVILLALGSELEPKRKDINEINKKLADDIFFMLNNLNLRHNNRSKSDKNYKEAVAKMRKPALEDWYDELYQMMLLAFLELDNKERNERVAELKAKING